MNNTAINIECNICTSIIDIFPSVDLKRHDMLQIGEGIFFVCGLCQEKIVQVFRCPNCRDLCVLNFTIKEKQYSPNVCLLCGKVEIYSTVELLPMVKMDRRYL
jgi:hypothetical protein